MRCAPSATGGSPRSSTRRGWRKHPEDHARTLLSLTQLTAAKDLTRSAWFQLERVAWLNVIGNRTQAGQWCIHRSRHARVGPARIKVGAIGLGSDAATHFGGHVLANAPSGPALSWTPELLRSPHPG